MADLRTKVAQQLGNLLLANIELGHELEAARDAAKAPAAAQMLQPAAPAGDAAPAAPQENPE